MSGCPSSSSGSEEEDEGIDSYRKGGYHAVRIGDSFAGGRYIAQQKLGWGQFSTVWLAYDTQSSVRLFSLYRFSFSFADVTFFFFIFYFIFLVKWMTLFKFISYISLCERFPFCFFFFQFLVLTVITVDAALSCVSYVLFRMKSLYFEARCIRLVIMVGSTFSLSPLRLKSRFL